MQPLIKRISKAVRPIRNYLINLAKNHPAVLAIAIYLLYLLIFQNKFLFSTDVWAETHAEYLYEATKHHFIDIFSYGWAGYITLIPSIAAKFYLKSPLPFGYADVFFQIIIVSIAVGASAFVSSKFNKSLFKS